MISYQLRRDFTGAEVEGLRADGFGGAPAHNDWKAQVERHRLSWVCARRGAELARFVDVTLDGGLHASILDATALD